MDLSPPLLDLVLFEADLVLFAAFDPGPSTSTQVPPIALVSGEQSLTLGRLKQMSPQSASAIHVLPAEQSS